LPFLYRLKKHIDQKEQPKTAVSSVYTLEDCPHSIKFYFCYKPQATWNQKFFAYLTNDALVSQNFINTIVNSQESVMDHQDFSQIILKLSEHLFKEFSNQKKLPESGQNLPPQHKILEKLSQNNTHIITWTQDNQEYILSFSEQEDQLPEAQIREVK
jgi:hypothetical protein